MENRRTWAVIVIVAQVVFILSWIIAATWQGGGYSVTKHSISDMYAVAVPHPWFHIVALTLTQAATILFAIFAAWPVFGEPGLAGKVGAVALALSVFGVATCSASSSGSGAGWPTSTLRWPTTPTMSGGRLDSRLTSISTLMP